LGSKPKEDMQKNPILWLVVLTVYGEPIEPDIKEQLLDTVR
jgi:hypothetical protein